MATEKHQNILLVRGLLQLLWCPQLQGKQVFIMPRKTPVRDLLFHIIMISYNEEMKYASQFSGINYPTENGCQSSWWQHFTNACLVSPTSIRYHEELMFVLGPYHSNKWDADFHLGIEKARESSPSKVAIATPGQTEAGENSLFFVGTLRTDFVLTWPDKPFFFMKVFPNWLRENTRC